MKSRALGFMTAGAMLSAVVLAASPCQAQFMKAIEQGLLGNQGQVQQQGQMPLQQGGGFLGGQQQPAGAALIGNVNLPPGQYLMTNVQTSQAFYVTIQGGQMFLSSQPGGAAPLGNNQLVPQQPQSGLGGLLNNGLNRLLNKGADAQQQQIDVPNP